MNSLIVAYMFMVSRRFFIISVSFFLLASFQVSAIDIDPRLKDKIRHISSQILKSRAKEKEKVVETSKVFQRQADLLLIAIDEEIKNVREEKHEKLLDNAVKIKAINNNQNVIQKEVKALKREEKMKKRVVRLEATLAAVSSGKEHIRNNGESIKRRGRSEKRIEKIVEKLESIKNKMKKNQLVEGALIPLVSLKSELLNRRTVPRMQSTAPTIQFVKTLQLTPPKLP
jgi:hypothetical protein